MSHKSDEDRDEKRKRKHSDKDEKKKKKRKKDEKKSKKKNSKRNSNSPKSRHTTCDNIFDLENDVDKNEIAQFKNAVQGKQRISNSDNFQASLLHCSQEVLATSFGLPKGLIRSNIEERSITQSYAKKLFGDDGDDDNPAKRMRQHRERVAQRAVETARAVVASRSAEINNSQTSVTDFANRFSSSTQRTF